MTPGELIDTLGPSATYVEENRPAGGRRFLDARDHFAAQLVAAWPDIEACLVEAKAAIVARDTWADDYCQLAVELHSIEDERDDLVRRLHESATVPDWADPSVCTEAADAITDLRERLAAAEAVCRIVDAEHTCEACENDLACDLGEALEVWRSQP